MAEGQELLAIVTALRDPYLEYFASWYTFAQFVEAGRMQDADALFDRVRVLANELGQPLTRWLDLLMQFTRAQLRGDSAAATALNEAQAEPGHDPQRWRRVLRRRGAVRNRAEDDCR
jgi:hypothetical protein